VQDLICKRGLGRDAEVQALEDALCLVFLETQFAELAARMTDDKTVDVLRKTLRKMSAAAKQHAVGFELGERERGLLERALSA
jgi:DNA-binding FadR family transcriptional regulator